VGCLVLIKGKGVFEDIKESYDKSKTKEELEERLKSQLSKVILPNDEKSSDSENIIITKSISEKIDEISYNDKNKRYVKPLLLAFNIALIRESKTRFNFSSYHFSGWDIEHINAKNPPTKEDERKRYILEYLTGKHKKFTDNLNKEDIRTQSSTEIFSEEDSKSLNNHDKLIFDYALHNINVNLDAKKLYEDLTKAMFVESNDSLGNLTLLSDYINRSYGNYPFCIKRDIILKNYYNGSFIPQGTMAVFTKHFTSTREVEKAISWNDDDEKKYLDKIKETITRYYFSEKK